MKRIILGLTVVAAASFLAPAAQAHPICTPIEWTGIPICVSTDARV
jgi:hypothetical protein